MTIARSRQVSLEQTPYYHCTIRCVRRAHLCGADNFSGRNYDHRRAWLVRRLALLSRVFSIDVLAYAIMSNHYHVVLRIDPVRAATWSNEEVRRRWSRVFTVADADSTATKTEIWRERLANLSWFMRCVNEPLARMANREDDCSGRFWEGRFKSQALLDFCAVLRCMVYVDLNPVRAGTAQTPESSPWTSIQARLKGEDSHLMPFLSDNISGPHVIPYRIELYLELVDLTGRLVRRDRSGRIPEGLPPIVERLGFRADRWRCEIQYFGKWYCRAAGSLGALRRYCDHLGQQWLRGMSMARPAPTAAK